MRSVESLLIVCHFDSERLFNFLETKAGRSRFQHIRIIFSKIDYLTVKYFYSSHNEGWGETF